MDDCYEPVPNAYRLIFVDKCILYYSFQHLMALYSAQRLIVNDLLWDRKRDNRADHIKHILLDAGSATAEKKLRQIDSYAGEFERIVKDELTYHGIVFDGSGKKMTASHEQVSLTKKMRKITL